MKKKIRENWIAIEISLREMKSILSTSLIIAAASAAACPYLSSSASETYSVSLPFGLTSSESTAYINALEQIKWPDVKQDIINLLV